MISEIISIISVLYHAQRFQLDVKFVSIQSVYNGALTLLLGNKQHTILDGYVCCIRYIPNGSATVTVCHHCRKTLTICRGFGRGEM
jgi:hypothetical protein